MLNSLLLYSLISFSLLIVISKISYKLNLVDVPNKRKIHRKSTAYTGGVALSIIYIFSTYFFELSIQKLDLIFSFSFLITMVGFLDDRYNFSAGSKLSLQIIPVFYLIAFENLHLDYIGNYEYFELYLGVFGIPFTLLCILFLINAFNYFDGIDGCLPICTISTLLILFFLIPDQNIKAYFALILIPIAIFLLFNFSFLKLPKLFLGDSGSLLLGFIVSFFLVYISIKNMIHPILIAWSVVIFTYEFIAINIIRLKINNNVLIPGQDHLHHIFFKKTKSIFFTNLILFSLNITLFSIGYLSFLFINPISSLILYMTIFIFFFIYRNKYKILN